MIDGCDPARAMTRCACRGALALLVLPGLLRGQAAAPLSLVPWPARVDVSAEGERFRVPAVVRIAISPSTVEMQGLARLVSDVIRDGTGRATSLVTVAPNAPDIRLRLSQRSGGHAEGYQLKVAADGIDLSARTAAGLFYGVQTLRQLIDAGRTVAPGSVSASLSAVTITDSPRFVYRGLHLDVGRHFMPVEFVKRYIDLMSRFKLNRFHWHLTDDQGWRVEIKRYPRLTTVGACRAQTILAKNFEPFVGDGVPHCGFYTQAEIRDVVRYAGARHVTIVPEIEMPGHSVAAIASYPWLSCYDKPVGVATSWGVEANIFCPSEQTFTFIEHVLREVISLFPGRYVHIGGDEAPKAPWKASRVAQGVITREQLKDENELQSYFIRRVERFLLRHGRRLIGWDEILEGGLAPDATVMSWRGTSGGIAAAKEGHDVIMTPTSHLYLDYLQGDARFEPLGIGGFVPLETVYAFEPVAAELTAEQGRHILGAQGNVWTEYMETPRHVEYMAYPRALALAELTWSPREARDWDSFVTRLPVQLTTLSRWNVNYRIPPVDGLSGDELTLEDQVTVRLRSLVAGATIRYTLDGGDPGVGSPVYLQAMDVVVPPTGVTVTARAFAADGRVSPLRSATFTRTTYRDPDVAFGGDLRPGLLARYTTTSVRSARVVDTMTAGRDTTIRSDGSGRTIALPAWPTPDRYTWRLTGWIRVPADGMYTFTLLSDDGALLRIGDRLVIDHDGLHGAEEKRGMIALRAGLHPITVSYFQGGGGAELRLAVTDGKGATREVPAEWFFQRTP